MKKNFFKNWPLVTLYIVSKNHEKYIAKCIKSALCQTYNNLELYIIDDNSLDKTSSIISKTINNKKKIKFFEKYIRNFNDLGEIDKNLKVAVITPDKDIIPNAETLNPAYIVFENYEIILQWNRSLRFALAVCTLKDKIKNET